MIENILQDAIQHSRNIFKGKTSNKTYRNYTKLTPNKMARYTPDNIRAREDKHDEFSDQLREINHITDKYRHCLFSSKHDEQLVGNCGELTIAAFNYLAIHRYNDILRWFSKNGRGRGNEDYIMNPIYILFLMFGDPYDHCIAVITHPRETQHKPTLNHLYRALPDHSWVCDPWANIACSSEEYIARWQRKMSVWNSKGKATSIYQEHQFEDYPSPATEENLNAINYSIKRVVYMAEIRPHSRTKIIQ